MLEDNFMYVIRKALRGLELAPNEAAERAGLDGAAVQGLLAGRWDEPAARLLAPAIGLDVAALAAHPDYEPPNCDHPAIQRLDLPFGEDEQVNAWLLGTGQGKLLIDAGCDDASLMATLERASAVGEIRDVIITHNHRDHVGGLGILRGRDVSVYGPVGAGGEWNELRPGNSLRCGDLEITVHDLAGHADPAIGLWIGGLGQPVLVVGDALFAGSIGGCAGKAAYQMAHRTLRAALDGLPGTTILLPGHGPATLMDAEWKSNPFLAGDGAGFCGAE